MMLRENFSWPEADAALRSAVRATLSEGYCTGDVAAPRMKVVGTDEFGRHLGRHLERILDQQPV